MSNLHPTRRLPRALPAPALAVAPLGVNMQARAQQPPPAKPRSWFASARSVMAGLLTRVERLEMQAGNRGRDGRDGRDGISILSAEVDGTGCLVLKLSNGMETRAGLVVGAPGPRGKKGDRGEIGAPGLPGRDAQASWGGGVPLVFDPADLRRVRVEELDVGGAARRVLVMD